MSENNLKMDKTIKTNGDNPLLDVMSKLIADGFDNPRMKLGHHDSNLMWSNWQYERTFLDWFLWTALYTQSWVFRNAVDKKSNATVADIEIESDAEPTKIHKVVSLYEHYKTDLKHLLKQAKIYGGAATAMMIEGTLYNTEKPLDISKIKKGAKMTLYTKDRWQGLQWEGVAGYDALGTDDFGRHKFYKFQVTGDTGNNIDNIKFHYSRVLRGGNRKPTQFTKYQLTGWDLPEGQHLLDELTRDETTRASVASLVSKTLIEVVKMPGIRGLFSGISGDLGGDSQASRTEIENRIKAVVDYRNFNNLSFLDKEDEYQQFQLSAITGLADILEQQRSHTSGAVEIPEMILYGSSSNKGLIFQSDGTNTPEIEIYQQTLNNDQDNILRPIMDKLLPVLWRIANGEDMPENTSYQFLPVFKESQTVRLERAALVVNTSDKLLKMGVYSSRDVGVEVRQHSKQTGFGTNLTDDKLSLLSDERYDHDKPEEQREPEGDEKVRTEQGVNKNNKARNYKFERRGGDR